MDMATNAMGIEKSIKNFMDKRFGSSNLKSKNDEEGLAASAGLKMYPFPFMVVRITSSFCVLGSGSTPPLHFISSYFLYLYNSTKVMLFGGRLA